VQALLEPAFADRARDVGEQLRWHGGAGTGWNEAATVEFLSSVAVGPSVQTGVG